MDTGRASDDGLSTRCGDAPRVSEIRRRHPHCGDRQQITFAVPSIVPAMTDTLVIDGVELVMKDLRPVPPAGTSVAYIAFVAG